MAITREAATGSQARAGLGGWPCKRTNPADVVSARFAISAAVAETRGEAKPDRGVVGVGGKRPGVEAAGEGCPGKVGLAAEPEAEAAGPRESGASEIEWASAACAEKREG